MKLILMAFRQHKTAFAISLKQFAPKCFPLKQSFRGWQTGDMLRCMLSTQSRLCGKIQTCKLLVPST